MRTNSIFLKKLAVFILLVLGMNTMLNVLYDRWIFFHRLNRHQDQQFENYSDTLKYLMLGNSHDMINPDIIGNSFCYVSPRELYLQTYYKFRYILEKTNKKPENILLSIDPVNFSPKAETDIMFDGYWRKYLDYKELAHEYHDPSYFLRWLTGNFFSYVGGYQYIFKTLIYIKFDISKIQNGYLPQRNFKNFAKETNRGNLGLERATAYLASYSDNSDLGAVKYYGRILDLCRKYNIRPILLRMPLTDEYLEHAGKMVNLEKLDRAIIAVSRIHCPNFRLFDFRNEFHGKPEYFFNADHVNSTGAIIISRKIKKELEQESDNNPR